VFAPWLTASRSLPFNGSEFIGETHLEVKSPSGLRGTPPTLDCVVDGAHVLAIESKCTETFEPHRAEFAAAYAELMSKAHASWTAEYQRLIEDPRRYRYLDAAQLVKHYLGLRHQFTDRYVTLAYLYWEPANAEHVPACVVHAAEVREFAKRVDDAHITFVGMSYRALWDEWAQLGYGEHVVALRRRYDVAI
jgi:hypothetical protein